MFSSLRDEVDPTIAAISTMLVFVTTVPPLLAHLFGRRRRQN
jgi:putative spermidine/putrescine transport system permease protein